MAQSAKIEVTTAFERVVHWVLAISCLLLMFTGLGLLYKSWTWLAGLFGGALGMKAVHDVAAWFFMVSLVPTFFMWLKDCSGIDGILRASTKELMLLYFTVSASISLATHSS